MKVKAYMRVGYDARRRQSQVAVNTKPTSRPLTKGAGVNVTPLPTVAFAVEFEIPDRMFKQAEQVIATLSIPESAAQIAAEVVERGEA